MSWQDSELVANRALNGAGFRGYGGYEVQELALILERDTLLEQMLDAEYLIEAEERVRYLTNSYILTQW